MKEKNTFCENEEISRFGEFVTSYFGWLPISKQKDRAEEMNNMTKDNYKNNRSILTKRK